MTKRYFICYVSLVWYCFVAVLVCGCVCGRFGLWPFWFVAVLDVCPYVLSSLQCIRLGGM